jgi:predicted adenylyl cyclase CyaB
VNILNIEIKAKSRDNNSLHKQLLQLNARFIGEDHQIDTYYQVNEGRLKLREGNIENSLIRYFREDKKGLKKSSVILHRTRNAYALKEILNSLFEISNIVNKRRKIYFIDNVKFHLDEVEGLGEFVEIEAIGEGGKYSQKELELQCKSFMDLLGISNDDLVADSYCDLVKGI